MIYLFLRKTTSLAKSSFYSISQFTVIPLYRNSIRFSYTNFFYFGNISNSYTSNKHKNYFTINV